MAATLFVFIGTGTATTFSATEGFVMTPEAQGGQAVGDVAADVSKLTNNVLTNGSWGITTALAFGFAITVMAYATGHLSGGQINPAVSLSLFVGSVVVGMLSFMMSIAHPLTKHSRLARALAGHWQHLRTAHRCHAWLCAGVCYRTQRMLSLFFSY